MLLRPHSKGSLPAFLLGHDMPYPRMPLAMGLGGDMHAHDRLKTTTKVRIALAATAAPICFASQFSLVGCCPAVRAARWGWAPGGAVWHRQKRKLFLVFFALETAPAPKM